MSPSNPFELQWEQLVLISILVIPQVIIPSDIFYDLPFLYFFGFMFPYQCVAKPVYICMKLGKFELQS